MEIERDLKQRRIGFAVRCNRRTGHPSVHEPFTMELRKYNLNREKTPQLRRSAQKKLTIASLRGSTGQPYLSHLRHDWALDPDLDLLPQTIFAITVVSVLVSRKRRNVSFG